MRWTITFIAVAMVLVLPGIVKAENPSAELHATLTLDEGFVGRPVSLALFDGAFTLSWKAGTIIAPTTLDVTFVQGVTSTEDQQIAAPGVAVAFSNTDAVRTSGAFTFSVKAHRPPAQTEASEAVVRVFGSVSSTIANGAFRGDQISFTAPASASLTVSPVYRDGIMREGMASWYAYKKCLCAASPDVPKGTRMIVRRADNAEKFVVVTINDWGPERDKHPERVIDLDKVAFARIGNPRGGVMAVTVEVIPREHPLWKLGDEIPPPNLKKLLAALKP